MPRFPVLASLILSANIVLADDTTPYAGQQQREIKALSAQEMQDYLDGKGMFLAKAAELNHFPGPAHVLALADKLQLTPVQKAGTQRIFDAMQRHARDLGKALVEKERELDRLFAGADIDKATLASRLREIGSLQAELRRVHLAAHVEQRAILSAAQIAAYDVLRGYGSDNPTTHQNHSYHHR